MAGRVFSLLLLVLFHNWAVAAPVFEYGPRPVSGVYDPERSLSPELTRLLTEELSKVRKRDLADVLVVVLPGTGEVPPEHLARRFSDAWGKGPLHAVVLDSTNRTDGPWILFGGEISLSDEHEIMPQMARDILRRAHQEPDRESCLRAASLEASDMLRYLLGKVHTQGEVHRTQRLQKELDVEHGKRIKTLMLLGGTGALLLLIGIAVPMVLMMLRKRARHFPPILWTRRFGAPYAGGNDAFLDLTRRRPPFL